MKPAADALVDLAAKRLPASASVLDLGGAPVPSPRLAGRRVTVVREDEALAYLQAHGSGLFDGVLAAWPTGFAPLIPLLSATRDALRPDGLAFFVDLVWQTAPTPELIRAFAPAPGREKVRPIEGYEMQIDHAGFEIVERLDVDRARWAPALPAEKRVAVEADARGAARVCAWVLKPASG